MAACDVCLDLDWDLYPPSKAIDTGSTELESSASQGCVPCRIIRRGIELIEEDVILPAGGQSHFACPCLLHITLRKNRSLVVEIRSVDDVAVCKNYEMELEFYSMEGKYCIEKVQR